MDKDNECNYPSKDSANEVPKTGADEVTDTLYVGHDAGGQSAGAVLIVERDGQAANVLLHPYAQFCDKALAGNGKIPI